jgi:beta-galactosidase
MLYKRTLSIYLRLLGCIFITVLIPSGLIAQNYIGQKKLYYGCAYYPEAWGLQTVDEDIARMKELNMNVMRIAEFSWVVMEPVEGQFRFDWLHQVIDKLHNNGIEVVLGTPTATPPTWMAEKYPEIFVVDETGQRRTHGARRNCSYTNEIYREKSRIIVEKMAKEFGKKPGVIGWQTDNEFHLTSDYSQTTEKRWHDWLKNRYGSIDEINEKWNLNLWSQRYNNFEQIPMPRSGIWHHPSLQMAWYRFTNDMVDEYQDIHLEAIRKYSDLPITHDGMPGQRTNYVQLFDDLDFMAVNNYHSFEAYDRIQSNYDRMRGYHQGFHWLFETAPNYSGGGKKGNTWFLHQPEGSMQAAMWMNYGLGGQGTMFWLWRQHWAGQEMPHGSIISSWGKPAANYNDLKELGKQLQLTSDFLMENPVIQAEAAIFWSHENLKGLTIEEYANGMKYYNDWTYRFYLPIADAQVHRDVIHEFTDISQYKLLMIPMMPYVPMQLQDRLQDWVINGGILLVGPMTGYRTEEWTGFKQHAMGEMAEWMDIEVDSRIPIGTVRRPAEIPVLLNFEKGLMTESPEASLWSEALSTDGGSILAFYKNGMHDGKPAIIENRVGQGKVVLLGTDPGEKAYQKLVLKYADEAGVKPLSGVVKDVVISPRKGPSGDGYVIVNISNQEKEINLDVNGYEDLLRQKKMKTNGKLSLGPYDFFILRK